MHTLFRIFPVLPVLFMPVAVAHADAVDDYIQAQMQKRHIAGLSLAIIDQGKIVRVKGYGKTDQKTRTPVTPTTLFQAGSISKSVAALGALHLVEQGRLDLDKDVNTELTTWKVPENEFTQKQKVTLRGILSHSAGLTVHGFPGYAIDSPIPTLMQVLDGEKPANTPAIRVDILPGSRWRYSGGGYTVMQQAILDVTGKPFPQFMQETVLTPLGMTDSSYQQPLPDDRARRTATGHYPDGSAVKGRWHVYPEMAAAGLWTTPTDLARFAISLQQSLAGTSNPVISQAMTRQMLTNQKQNDGLGLFLESKAPTLRFSHDGRDEGFDAMLIAYSETGQGAAIMINANENSDMVSRIVKVIAQEYHWPDYPALTMQNHPKIKISGKALEADAGYYEIGDGQLLILAPNKGHLAAWQNGFYLDEFLPDSETVFSSDDLGVRLTFSKPMNQAGSDLSVHQGAQDVKMTRIGPLVHTLTPSTDPDPALTQKVTAGLLALAKGGKAVEASSDIAPGSRKDFAGGPLPELAKMKSVSYIAAQDVAENKIHRHGGEVRRILYYTLTTARKSQYLLVYLISDGLVTDVDVVDH